jgi:hypothetical protein
MTETKLEKAKAALAQAEARIAERKAERERRLIAGDETEAIRGLDREIIEIEADCGIYQQRIAKLEEEIRDQHHAQRERTKDKQIAKLERILANRSAIAHELQDAIKRMGDLFFELAEMRSEVINAWPGGLPPPTFKTLQGTVVMMETSWALWYAGRPTAMSGSKLPKPSAMPGVAGVNQVGIGAAAEAEGQALIATLRRTPLAKVVDDVAVVESAAFHAGSEQNIEASRKFHAGRTEIREALGK